MGAHPNPHVRADLQHMAERVREVEADRDRLAEREQKAISILTYAVDDIDGDDLLELCRHLALDCNAEHDRATAAEAALAEMRPVVEAGDVAGPASPVPEQCVACEYQKDAHCCYPPMVTQYRVPQHIPDLAVFKRWCPLDAKPGLWNPEPGSWEWNFKDAIKQRNEALEERDRLAERVEELEGTLGDTCASWDQLHVDLAAARERAGELEAQLERTTRAKLVWERTANGLAAAQTDTVGALGKHFSADEVWCEVRGRICWKSCRSVVPTPQPKPVMPSIGAVHDIIADIKASEQRARLGYRPLTDEERDENLADNAGIEPAVVGEEGRACGPGCSNWISDGGEGGDLGTCSAQDGGRSAWAAGDECGLPIKPAQPEPQPAKRCGSCFYWNSALKTCQDRGGAIVAHMPADDGCDSWLGSCPPQPAAGEVPACECGDPDAECPVHDGDGDPPPKPAAGEVPAEVHERGWQWRPVGDGAFAPPFGTIRVCRGCGCLVAGGPTACVRCASQSEPQRAEVVARAVQACNDQQVHPLLTPDHEVWNDACDVCAEAVSAALRRLAEEGS